MASLIQWAYLNLREWTAVMANRIPRILQEPLTGGPAWVNSDRFQVVARAAGPATLETMKGSMMRTLLEERFRLKIHRATKEVSVYELSVAKGGPKLQPAKEGGCIPLEEIQNGTSRTPGGSPPRPCGYFFRSRSNDGLDSPGATMASLCDQLSVILDRQVIDKTGITGSYDIHLDVSFSDFAPKPRSSDVRPAGDPGAIVAATDPAGSAVFASVQRLGLRIDSAKGLGDHLVIDHIEIPSGN